MTDNKTIVIIGVLVVFALACWIIGRRLKSFKVKVPGVSAEAQGDTAGPIVQRATAAGKKNRITADGVGAVVQDVDAIGEENLIGAGTQQTPDEPKR